MMIDDEELFEFEVSCSKTKSSDERISCAVYTVGLYAKDEAAVRKIMADEEPDLTIDSIKLIGPA
ncbi:hypothetical protein [Methylomonas rapida]|uniref:Uncharacterized protein n=1 Tax=Methylomonas rapida TaxID=2963939 RepID=A0ABY7GLY7_9GAMM|nr:hypothetical protein [Methylomonas rapida]WAR43635.1 hypothetical protein NM686_014775 [Methylomonas rapida]WAR45509.1 hypothetical protein NM686_003060 [Methylomonas rapida]